MSSQMELALLEFEEAEIKAANTPLFFRDEVRAEPIGANSTLDKVLNWWRTDVWIPPEMRIQPKPPCPFCQVLRAPERSIGAGAFIPGAAGYRIIMNNKWVFPNHFLMVPLDCSSHVITPARIEILCSAAMVLPSFMLYVTSRGLGIPQHFHGHLVKSNYVPPLVRAAPHDYLGEVVRSGICQVSEVRQSAGGGSAGESRYVAGWAVTGPESKIASAVIDVARICTEEVLSGTGLQVDLFWGPRHVGKGEANERTVFLFPRRADGGKYKERLGATEFVGLFAFSSNQYFVYSTSEAAADLSAAGLAYADRTRERISERIRSSAAA